MDLIGHFFIARAGAFKNPSFRFLFNSQLFLKKLFFSENFFALDKEISGVISVLSKS